MLAVNTLHTTLDQGTGPARASRRRVIGPRGWLLAAAGLLAVAGHAAAQVQPHPRMETSGRYAAVLENGQLTLTDTITFRPLISTGHRWVAIDHEVMPTVRLEPAAKGVDLVYRFENSTAQPKSMGRIQVSGIRFAPQMNYWRLRHSTEIQRQNGWEDTRRFDYPNDTYSPVNLFGDNRHVMGISLIAPLVEYNQALHTYLRKSASGNVWESGFELNSKIPPGQVREFRIAVRIATPEEHPLSTLLPYRDYFHQTYGPVRYERDTRVVFGDNYAAHEHVTSTNPRGFRPGHRPDLNGFSGAVRKVRRELAQTGMQRLMMWNVSGIYRENTNMNFPFTMMTGLDGIPAAAGTLSLYRQLQQDNIQYGFWWGHSTKIMEGWDTGVSRMLNPNNPRDVAAGYAELDRAVEAGATLIGLDAFVMERPGDLYNWLRMMQQRAPQVRFVTEQMASDIIHSLAPTYTDNIRVTGRHEWADMLNPGHEIWAGVMQWPNPLPGTTQVSPAQKAAEITRLARFGYVPLIFNPIDPPEVAVLAGWDDLPAALRPPARRITAPGGSGGAPPIPLPGGGDESPQGIASTFDPAQPGPVPPPVAPRDPTLPGPMPPAVRASSQNAALSNPGPAPRDGGMAAPGLGLPTVQGPVPNSGNWVAPSLGGGGASGGSSGGQPQGNGGGNGGASGGGLTPQGSGWQPLLSPQGNGSGSNAQSGAGNPNQPTIQRRTPGLRVVPTLPARFRAAALGGRGAVALPRASTPNPADPNNPNPPPSGSSDPNGGQTNPQGGGTP